ENRSGDARAFWARSRGVATHAIFKALEIRTLTQRQAADQHHIFSRGSS
ncbi:unnamed protein product, partial [Scytosiphon promiscuus]